MESNSLSFVLYLDHLLLFTDQTVQFTHYIIFAKINGIIFIKEPMVYTKPLQAGLHAMTSSICSAK